MSWRTGDVVTAEFTTRGSTGAANADSLPTAKLVINGVDDGVSVTVTNKATGIYKASVTLPTTAEGDLLQIRVSATVSGVSDNADIWAGRTSYSLPYAAPGAASGLALVGSAMTLTSGERDAIAAAILDLAAGVETNRTVRQALRLILAALAAKLSGAGTNTVTIRDTNDSKNRIVATVDASGNRSAVTLDAT